MVVVFTLYVCTWHMLMLNNIPGITSRCLGTKSPESGVTVYFCCDNHEDQNGKCVECQSGYEAETGKPCKKCSQGFYGRKCGDVCYCENDRCHHVFGCVNVSNTSPVSKIYKAGRLYSYEKQSTLSTTLQRTPSTGSTTGDTSVFGGLHRREIIVYSIGTGLVSIILLVCTFLLRRYKQRGANTLPILHSTTTEQPLNDMGLREQAIGSSTEIVEGIYETIDESNLLPDLPISMHTRNESNDSSGSSSDDNSDPLPSDGYLNPYQPMAQEFEVHGYSAIVAMSDSDCSSSCKDDRVSGYLNPYQMIVPDHETHEYLKVNDDSSLEKKNVSDFSNQSCTGTYIDAHSKNTSGKYAGTEENKNQCEKIKPHVHEDNYDIDEKVKASIFVEEQTCDIDMNRYIGGNEDSSENQKKIDHCHEISGSSDTPETTCHLNNI